MDEIKINLVREIGGEVIVSYETNIQPQTGYIILWGNRQYEVIRPIVSIDIPDVLVLIVKYKK